MPQARIQFLPSRKSGSTAPKARKGQNGNILNFFKKSPADDPLFMPGGSGGTTLSESIWIEESSTKRRRISDGVEGRSAADTATEESALNGNTLEANPATIHDDDIKKDGGSSSRGAQKKRGPFLDDSESEPEEDAGQDEPTEETPNDTNVADIPENNDDEPDLDDEDFDEIGDFGDSDQEEEAQEQRWLERQRAVELEQAVFEHLSSQNSEKRVDILCPICNLQLNDLSEGDSSIHVNKCLDGTVSPVKNSPPAKDTIKDSSDAPTFARPAKPAQKDPFSPAAPGPHTSAFTKLMAGKAEDAAWATAAAAEAAARGRPAYERTCPFYKILPGFSVCVDAFRYGAVAGCRAYFLSHFHSDHYVGLTASWAHGPIYCSRVTANLVREQLKVDGRWVVPLEFECEMDVPDTPGVVVTMIPANHCPGSAMFLFEKVTAGGQGGPRRLQRILHCGDFRASKEMLTHPRLRPDPVDPATGRKRQQRIDTCYLDTTYLNPKYAFPSQARVIQACADLVVALDASPPDDLVRASAVARNGSAIPQFLQPSSSAAAAPPPPASSSASRLLVVVGTYSIGKERLCVALARALGSRIYAAAAKRRVCACLEDPELDGLLTSDPRAAQVHMAPLFELRADALAAYLDAQQPPQPAQTTLDGGGGEEGRGRFTHAVALRPTGWTYRAPRHTGGGGGGGPRAAAAPVLDAVLRGAAWRSPFAAADLAPQRGSTPRAAVYGVPYSEHSSFRELCAFACALRIDRIVPTVNVGSAASRERMRWWVERWAEEKRKNGLLSVDDF
jgi:DNA cross-link repair 1A protein